MRTMFACALVAFVGCGAPSGRVSSDGSAGGHDGAAPTDLGAALDLAHAGDLGSAADLGSAHDLAAALDLGAHDLAAPPDLGGHGCALYGQACSANSGCATGTYVCNGLVSVCSADQPVTDGTSCGTNLYCVAGQCQSCATGSLCYATACTYGWTRCTTGVQTCMPSGSNVANGTTCGTDQVCDDGQCVGCVAGGSCASPNPCTTAAISCASGSAVCTPTTNLADGTSCGTNQVCYQGHCGACIAGSACQPTASSCQAGQLSCTSGQPKCLAGSGTQPNGTSCGSNEVCDNGTCSWCVAGGACTAPDACKAGVYSCASGAQTCVDGANLADGASCGTNLVCHAGSCNACAAGAPCTPANACHNGTLDCSTGTPVCKDAGTNVGNGASCGTDAYCYAGACTGCVGGGSCTPSDACASGTWACAGGQRVCQPSGPSGASSCGITTVGSCVGDSCQCPSGSGLWNGDCAVCPSPSSSGTLAVNADPNVGADNQCCGRTSTAGFGGPCLTVTQAIANVPALKSPGSTAIYVVGDPFGNLSVRESYPLRLPAGVGLHASVATVCVPGVAGQEVVHVDSTGTTSAALRTDNYSSSVTRQWILGTSCAGVASGASTGIYVGSGGSLTADDVLIRKTTTGAIIDGGSLTVDSGTLAVNDLPGDGVVCKSVSHPSDSSRFAMSTLYNDEYGWFSSARVAGRAIYASSNCWVGSNQYGGIALGSSAPCPSPKLDGDGIVADGNAIVSVDGSIQCMSGDGIALRANPALASNSPSVQMGIACSWSSANCRPSYLGHNGCAGAYADCGQLTLDGVQLVHNHWGVHQKSSAPASTDPAQALVHVQSSGSIASRFACSTSAEPGRCCVGGNCEPGANVFNESALVLSAAGDQWPDSPLRLCTGCDPTLQSCACSTGGAAPPDGIDVVTLAGGTTDVSNYALGTPVIQCN